MRDLLVNRWEDFEEIGCYWMQTLVEEGMPYSVYGSVGQAQHGVDLVPLNMNFGIVGQAKCVGTLAWPDIEKELVKTDKYPGPIRRYVILTTAAKNTSVQDKMKNGSFTYMRPQGPFQVQVHYWSDLQDLNFIPMPIQLRMFPSLAAQARATAESQLSTSKFSESLLQTRRLMPELIPQEHREWLESWDFYCGYVPQDKIDLFHMLSIDINRVLTAQNQPGLHEFLFEGPRNDLARCLPAANSLFLAVIAFARAVVDEASTAERAGTLVLAHGHNDYYANQRIASSWRESAKALVDAYRRVVEGAPQG